MTAAESRRRDWEGRWRADFDDTDFEGCQVDGCDRPFHAKGLCSIHYDRKRRTGSTDLLPRPNVFDRFWAKVVQKSADECWLWTGTKNDLGYGNFLVGERRLQAHRIAYELTHGVIVPKGLVMDHLCRTPSCVNPSHLEPVTNAENIRRGWALKRRTHCLRGHEYTPENTYIKKLGGRDCKTCVLERDARRRAQLTPEQLAAENERKKRWARDRRRQQEAS